MAQRLVRHHGTEVGAADADVDDVADRLPRLALPFARADAIGERGHPVEHVVHLGHDVHAVDHQGFASRHPECDVQHRSILGGVDPLAAEHRLDPLLES